MTNRDEQIERTREIWREKLADYIVKGRLGRALDCLARIIDAPPSLFDDDQVFVTNY